MKKIFVLFLLSTFISSTSLAGSILYGSTPEPVVVQYGEETIFRFPSPVMSITKASRFIIQPASEDSPDYSVLSVRPRFSKGTNKVNFILSDGEVVRVKLTVSSRKNNKNADSIYDFRSKSSLLADSPARAGAPPISELQLMRAMISGRDVSGYEIKQLSQEISTGMRGVKGILKTTYIGPEFTGYIFTLKNVTQSHSYLIRIPNLAFGNPNTALLGNIDNANLEPINGKNLAILRVVAKSNSSTDDVVLPVTYISKKKDK